MNVTTRNWEEEVEERMNLNLDLRTKPREKREILTLETTSKLIVMSENELTPFALQSLALNSISGSKVSWDWAPLPLRIR